MVSHQHSLAGSLHGILDLGHCLPAMLPGVLRYYPAVNYPPMHTASNKELICVFNFCDLWPNLGQNGM